MSKIFVYGTLKKGHRAHNFLEEHNAVFLKEVSTHPEYHLYKLGWFPGMVLDEHIRGGVRGELYEVSEECLERLDQYEGAPHLFRREEMELDDGTTAISYLYRKEFSQDDRIEGGVWE